MANKVKCVIISGAPENDLSYYFKYLTDSYIICADSGYLKCQSLNITPNLIVGDFDSAPAPVIDCEIITLNRRKDDTDTFHCIKLAAERGYNDIIILGGIGDRFDHTYSNLLSLVYCYDRNIKCALVNAKNYIIVESGEITLAKSEYKYFSLFALFEKCEGLSIKGAEYELDNVELEPFSQLTQSNAFKNETVCITIKKGKIILILSND